MLWIPILAALGAGGLLVVAAKRKHETEDDPASAHTETGTRDGAWWARELLVQLYALAWRLKAANATGAVLDYAATVPAGEAVSMVRNYFPTTRAAVDYAQLLVSDALGWQDGVAAWRAKPFTQYPHLNQALRAELYPGQPAGGVRWTSAGALEGALVGEAMTVRDEAIARELVPPDAGYIPS